MSDKPSKNEQELAAMVLEVGTISAQKLLERLIQEQSEGFSARHISEMVVRSWQQVALPLIEELCLARELDIRPLRQNDMYQDLYLSALQHRMAAMLTALSADERPSARSLVEERARASASEVVLVAGMFERARSQAQREWLAHGLARTAWHESVEALDADFTEFDITSELARYESLFCESFAKTLNERVDTPGFDSAQSVAPSLRPPKWRHAGPQIPDTGGLPEPRFQTDYGLAYDAGRAALVYVQRIGESTLGPLWCLHDDSVWRKDEDGSPFALGGEPCTRLSLHYDHSREATVGWLCVKHDIFQAVPVGIRFSAGGPQLVPITSQMPVIDRGDNFGHEFSTVFAYDAGRRVTVAVTPDALWQLDPNGYWTQCVEREEGSATRDWPTHELIGAAYDRPRERVIIWALVTPPDDRFRQQGRRFFMFSWDGQSIEHMGAAGLPVNSGPLIAEHDAAVAICEHPEHGLLAYAPTLHSFYRMTDAGWEPCTLHDDWHWRNHMDEAIHVPELDEKPTPDPYPGASPPDWFGGVCAAWDREHGSFVLGPGTYQVFYEWGKSTRAMHAFYTMRDRVWREAIYEHPEPPLIPSFDFIIDGPDGAVAVSSSSAVHGFDPHQRAPWIPLIDDYGDMLRGSVTAVVRARDGEVCAVSDQGEIAYLEKTTDSRSVPVYQDGRLAFEDAKNYRWRRIYTPQRLSFVVERVLDSSGPYGQVCAAYDRRSYRVVVWRDRVSRQVCNQTVIWRPDEWSEIAHDSPMPPGSKRTRDRCRFLMIFDSGLDRVVRFSEREFSVLDQDAWRSFPADPVLMAIHPGHRGVVHDLDSGQTLLFDYVARQIVRFDIRGSTLLSGYDWPDGYVVTEQQDIHDPGFPLHRVGFLSRSQCLRTHSDADVWENYELDLGPVLAEAEALGPRVSYDEFLRGPAQQP